MRIRKGIALVAASLITSGLGVAFATPALATPDGCTRPDVSFSHLAGNLHGESSSDCNVSATRTLVVEIKWDHNLLPDPTVASTSDHHTGRLFRAFVNTCDDGNNRSYYARGYFTVDDDFVDTVGTHVTSCD